MATEDLLLVGGSSIYGLPLAHNEIRLLSKVKPAAGSVDPQSTELQCCLVAVPYDEWWPSATEGSLPSVSYIAVSYVWAEMPGRRKILCNHQEIEITVNLYQALCQIWQEEPTVRIWADALCINQDDPVERSAQVAMMGKIFSNATCVHVWLGVEQAATAEAWEFLIEVAKSLEAYQVISYPELFKVLKLWEARRGERIGLGLRDMSARSWFNRAWTLQEFVLAGSLAFRCGKLQMDGRMFCSSIRSITRLVAPPGEAAITLQNESTAWSTMNPIMRATSILDARLNRPVNQSLLPLLLQNWKREATDDRDKVYSILGMVKDCELSPDYQASRQQAYSRAAQACIKQDESLLTLIYAYGEKVGGLPSWAPDWRAICYWDQHIRIQWKLNMFMAEDESPSPCTYEELEELHILSLKATAVCRLSSIRSKSRNFMDSSGFVTNFPECAKTEWFRLRGLTEDSSAQAKGSTPDHAFQEFAKAVQHHDRNYCKCSLGQVEVDLSVGPYLIKPWADAQVGDWIAVFDGGPVPFILRPELHPGNNPQEVHQVGSGRPAVASTTTLFRLVGHLTYPFPLLPLDADDRLQLVLDDGHFGFVSSFTDFSPTKISEERQRHGLSAKSAEVEFWQSLDCIPAIFNLT